MNQDTTNASDSATQETSTAKIKRTLENHELHELANKLVELAKGGRFPDDSQISCAKMAKEFEITTSLMKNVYITAIPRMNPAFPLDIFGESKGKAEIPCLGKTLGMKISSKIIKGFNKEISDETKRFKEGDKFHVDHKDGVITLNLVRENQPQ